MSKPLLPGCCQGTCVWAGAAHSAIDLLAGFGQEDASGTCWTGESPALRLPVMLGLGEVGADVNQVADSGKSKLKTTLEFVLDPENIVDPPLP